MKRQKKRYFFPHKSRYFFALLRRKFLFLPWKKAFFAGAGQVKLGTLRAWEKGASLEVHVTYYWTGHSLIWEISLHIHVGNLPHTFRATRWKRTCISIPMPRILEIIGQLDLSTTSTLGNVHMNCKAFSEYFSHSAFFELTVSELSNKLRWVSF